MVVLSIATLTKTGKVLLSRQFMPLSKMRIEALLQAFTKLVIQDSQHTFVESDDVRYVYQPLDQLYVVLITNSQSNIMEDLETLRLVAKVIPEYCSANTEEAVMKNVFSLIFAFDEIVTLGYRENVNVEQIKSNLIMDSHEEKLQAIIKASQINAAKIIARQRAEGIEKKKLEERTKMNYEGGGSSSGMGSNSFSSSDSYSGSNKYGSSNNSSSNNSSNNNSSTPTSSSSNQTPTTPSSSSSEKKVGKGMALGKAKKNEIDFASQVKKLEVKGEMKIVVSDPDDAKIIIKTTGLTNPEFKLRVAPKVDSNSWTKNAAVLWKDGKGFPVGADNAAVVLKWRFSSGDDRQIPITLNFWSNVEDGRTVVTVDYQAEKAGFTFQNVHIIIPCKAKELPQVSNADGTHHYDNKEKSLVWTIDEISESKSKGSLEFSLPEVDPDIFIQYLCYLPLLRHMLIFRWRVSSWPILVKKLDITMKVRSVWKNTLLNNIYSLLLHGT